MERGEDPRLFTLIAFGGAGPMHGCAVAQEMGIRRVVAPNYPGNLSALGLLTSDLKHEFVRTHLTLLQDADMSVVAERLDQMGKEGRSLLVAEGIASSDIQIIYILGIRYRGQSHELDIEVSPKALDREELGKIFHQRYYEAWSYSPDTKDIQLVNVRVIAIGQAPKLAFPPLDGNKASLNQAKSKTRGVYFAGAVREAPVYERTLLPPEAILRGPAIVEEDGSTTVIFPDWDGRVDDVGNIIIEAR